MNNPVVSVILPVYNCEAYVDNAIRSILEQTFTDFELIIINDGSTDKSEFVIQSSCDWRIHYVKNEQNRGLIFSLNRGVSLACGEFIAIMHADDICLSQRLEKQVIFLRNNTGISAVASTAEIINSEGNIQHPWILDRETLTEKNIRRKMPFENCIAHPTVMIRKDVFAKLKYNSYPLHREDYDLWLRMLNRGYRIAKISEPLLQYREHTASVTGTYLRKDNPYLKHLALKSRILIAEFFSGHISLFLLMIKLSALRDLFMGLGKMIKNLLR